ELVAVGLQHLLVRLLVRPDDLARAREHERAARIVVRLRRGLRGARALARRLDDLLREFALRRTYLRHEGLQLLGAARERVPRRAIIADPQMALHERNRRAAVLDDDLDRLVVQRIRLAAAFTGSRAGRTLVAVGGATFEQPFDVVRLAVLLELLDDAMHFVVGD